MLLRCLRRRTSFEPDTTAESLCQLEFADRLGYFPLELSVYSAGGASETQCIEIALCHGAAAGSDPPRFVRAVDVSPVRSDARPDPVECAFPAIGKAHAVLDFATPNDLLAFATALLEATGTGRAAVFRADGSAVKDHLRRLRKSGDQDWLTFLSENEEWAKKSLGPGSVFPPPQP